MKQFFLNLAADATRPFAAPAAVDAVTPAGIGSLGQVTLALGLVLAIIFGVAWFTRRMRLFGKPRSAALDVLADLPLGQKERAVLIRCGTRQLLLGVAPGRVTTLHVLDEPAHLAPPEEATDAARPDFKAILKRSLGL